MRRAWSSVLSVLLALSFAGCKPSEGPVTLKRRPKYYKAVVSLSPGTTEVFASLLGRTDLKGRTAADNWPKGLVQNAPVVASVKPDYEKLAQIHPDLILYDASLYSDADVEKLKSLGAELYKIDAKTLDEFIRQLFEVSMLLGGETHISDYVDKIRVEEEAALANPLNPIPKVAILMPGSNGHYMVAGTDSFLADVVKNTGGQLIGPKGDIFVDLSPETLISENPDVVIVPGTREDVKGATTLLTDTRFASVKAIRSKSIGIIDPDVLLRRGARVDKLLNAVYRIVHGKAGNSK